MALTPTRCKARLRSIEANLLRAIKSADKRGYTGMLHSKGGLADDPVMKALTRKRDALMRKR